MHIHHQWKYANVPPMVNNTLQLKSLLRIVPSVVLDMIHRMLIDFPPQLHAWLPSLAWRDTGRHLCGQAGYYSYFGNKEYLNITSRWTCFPIHGSGRTIWIGLWHWRTRISQKRLFCKKRTYAPVCDSDVTRTFPVIARHQTRALWQKINMHAVF